MGILMTKKVAHKHRRETLFCFRILPTETKTLKLVLVKRINMLCKTTVKSSSIILFVLLDHTRVPIEPEVSIKMPISGHGRDV